MGTIQHRTVIVVGYDDITPAREKALELYGAAFPNDEHYVGEDAQRLVGPIVAGLANGYASFVLHPDGSKEGWTTSDAVTEAREAFLAWLEAEDRYEWATVGFGELGLQINDKFSLQMQTGRSRNA